VLLCGVRLWGGWVPLVEAGESCKLVLVARGCCEPSGLQQQSRGSGANRLRMHAVPTVPTRQSRAPPTPATPLRPPPSLCTHTQGCHGASEGVERDGGRQLRGAVPRGPAGVRPQLLRPLRSGDRNPGGRSHWIRTGCLFGEGRVRHVSVLRLGGLSELPAPRGCSEMACSASGDEGRSACNIQRIALAHIAITPKTHPKPNPKPNPPLYAR